MAVILIVDDDLVTRALVRHIVTDLGFEPLEASDGFEALDLLEAQAVDLVLCDQEMPGLTGLQLRAQLGSAFKAPFVLLTGYAEAEELASAQPGEDELNANNGIDGYMTKPMSSAELAELVQELLASSAA